MWHKIRYAAAALAVSFGAIALGACADDDASSGGNICDDMETPYEAYSAGLTKIGDSNHLKISLMSALPAPPERGMNAWAVQLKDMNDAPLPNATITAVTPFMPHHGHGSSVAPVIGTTDANGEVAVDSIDFMMPGVWTVTFEVDNAGQADTATFAFCIDG